LKRRVFEEALIKQPFKDLFDELRKYVGINYFKLEPTNPELLQTIPLLAKSSNPGTVLPGYPSRRAAETYALQVN